MASNTMCTVLIFLVFSIGFFQAYGRISVDSPSLKEPPLFKFDSQLDTVVTSPGNDIEIRLDLNISYFGGSYNTLYISKDGIISFERGVKYMDEVEVIWAEGMRNTEEDKPFMTPFLHNSFNPILMQAGTYQGKIYYRVIYKKELQPNEANYYYNKKTLDYLNVYTQEAVINAFKTFDAEVVLIVTWENVTDVDSSKSADCDKTSANPCKSATFQAVIVASETETYAVFNYLKMDIPYKKTYQSGFNGGHGRGWYNVIPCHGQCTLSLNLSRVNDLPNLYGSDYKGRYVLNVGKDKIVRGGCLPRILRAGMLEVYPTTVGMFGGEMLQVSGKCLPEGKVIYCKFGRKKDSHVTKGVMVNGMKGYCPVPILTTREPIVVQWSEDGENWTADRYINIALPDRLGNYKPRPQWYTADAKRITIPWIASEFSENGGARMDVKLLGYKEDKSIGKVEFYTLENLGSTENRQGQLTIEVSAHSCKSRCNDHQVGLLEVSLQEDYYGLAVDRTAVRYGPIPLGWYVREELTKSMGSDWSNQQCQAWYDRDGKEADWVKKITPCPCNLNQALSDFGRWQPGVGCNMITKTPCVHHTKAVHCVRSVQASPEGAGNQCCYEKEGNLLYSQLSFQGSTPDRSHAFGASPYRKPDFVPDMSHWIHDVVPFYQCCLWNNFEMCDHYTKLRPTTDCRNYDVPGLAMIRGMSHLTTFDGQEYSFGGQGDFWLVDTGSFRLQGRFTAVRGVWDLGKTSGSASFIPTALTSIALLGNGPIIEIHPQPKNDVTHRALDIRIANHRELFLTRSTMRQDYKGYTIINNAKCIDQNNHDDFTILGTNDVGLNVKAVNGLLHVTVSLPPSMKKLEPPQGMGLMGTYDGKNNNDLMSKSGRIISPSIEKSVIYKDFAMSWAVKSIDSLFLFGMAASDIDKYTPYFNYRDIPTSFREAPSNNQISGACGTDVRCQWDYRLTGQRDIALATKEANERIVKQRSDAVREYNCGLPDVGRNAELNSNFSQDSVVTVTGCGSDMSFSGQETLTCVTESVSKAKENNRDHYGTRHRHPNENNAEYITHWVPEPYQVCAEPSTGKTADAKVAMIIGISVGAVLLIIIVIIIVIIILKRRTSDSTARKEPPVPSRRKERDPRDPGVEESMLSSNRNPVYKPSDQSVRIGSSV